MHMYASKSTQNNYLYVEKVQTCTMLMQMKNIGIMILSENPSTLCLL